MNDALVTQAQAARILGVDRQYVRWLIIRGKLTGLTVAGRPHVLRAEVEQLRNKRAKREERKNKGNAGASEPL